MTKRLFFTCPVKALWMQQKFGVKFKCMNSDEELQEFDLNEEDRFFPFEHSICEAETIEDLLENFKHFRKIYVAEESEHIFEPQHGDLGLSKNNEFLAKWCDAVKWWNLIERDGTCKNSKSAKIIMRDNKQFFGAEVEND